MKILTFILVKIGCLSSYIFPYKANNILYKMRYTLYSGWINRQFKRCGLTCRFYPPSCFIRGGQFIELGDNIHFGRAATITAAPTNHTFSPIIKIGDGCVFGSYNHITACEYIEIGVNLRSGSSVLISDNSHGNPNDNYSKNIHPDKRPLFTKGPIIIGDNVWLGDNCVILGNVKIGKGVIVGANSVVTHDLPDFSVAVGAPARIVK